MRTRQNLLIYWNVENHVCWTKNSRIHILGGCRCDFRRIFKRKINEFRPKQKSRKGTAKMKIQLHKTAYNSNKQTKICDLSASTCGNLVIASVKHRTIRYNFQLKYVRFIYQKHTDTDILQCILREIDAFFDCWNEFRLLFCYFLAGRFAHDAYKRKKGRPVPLYLTFFLPSIHSCTPQVSQIGFKDENISI